MQLSYTAVAAALLAFMLAPAFLYYSSQLLHAVFVEKQLSVIFFLLCIGAAGWYLCPSMEESMASLERERAELQHFGHVVPTSPAALDPPFSSAPLSVTDPTSSPATSSPPDSPFSSVPLFPADPTWSPAASGSSRSSRTDSTCRRERRVWSKS
ncbi:unnamed protein product [Microthlaspi erraticum]|uniref:Uncharacterized protein n=1 Tax=Microthlaspi erraticum TaxID=1685480 RepID=A0A6D2HQT5_9BRAS|nr:unnamed protein product [Microthlaspi erraticum]